MFTSFFFSLLVYDGARAIHLLNTSRQLSTPPFHFFTSWSSRSQDPISTHSITIMLCLLWSSTIIFQPSAYDKLFTKGWFGFEKKKRCGGCLSISPFLKKNVEIIIIIALSLNIQTRPRYNISILGVNSNIKIKVSNRKTTQVHKWERKCT